jgi:F420-dependent oxidoreductase-like protein
MADLKLGLFLGFWGSTPPTDSLDLITEAERLAYDSIWQAEAWGSDGIAPLAWWGAHTTRLRLGTDVLQISARTPTATAQVAATMDHLSGGRFVLGLGVSGPQVVEGWHGQPFARPLARTREYVRIVRQALDRQEVTNPGPHYPVPYPGGTGLGKPLKIMTRPLRRDLPIFLAAEGPMNITLTAEIADGWLPTFFAPAHDGRYRDLLAEGFARRTDGRPADGFEVLPATAVVIDDDVEAAADRLRPFMALNIGGMGAETANFHFDSFARLGFEGEARKIQRLFLDGHRTEAIAAVPTALIEAVSLVGPREKIRDDLAAWKDSVATSLLLGFAELPLSTLRTMAELVL